MNNSKIEFLKKCEAELLGSFLFILDDFASEVDSKLIIQSNTLSWIELYFTNFKKSRTIQIIISEGINADKKQSYSIRFNIQKINPERENISSFSIRDFCNEMDLQFELKDFYIESPNFLMELKKYIESVNKVIDTEEMRAILFDEYWIDIKPDFSPYK